MAITVIDTAVGSAAGSSLRALGAAPPVGSRYETRGYATVGDGGHGVYEWNSSSTTADDGALTIKITAVATGRFKYLDTRQGIFPLYCSSVDHAGATEAGPALNPLMASLISAGYRGIDVGNGRYRVAAQPVTIPTRPEGVGFLVLGGTWDGTAATFAGTFQAVTSVETGNTGAGTTNNVLTQFPFTPRTWTQTMLAGDNVFNGVADKTNLLVGDTIFVRLGAEPTDASGVCAISYFAKITAITPTTGTAANITVDVKCPETPLFPLPAYNINFSRGAGNVHDFVKVTGFQDNIELRDNTFIRVLVAPNATRRFMVTRPTIPSGTACFSVAFTEDVLIDNARVATIRGVNGVGPVNNYGWFLVTNQARKTVVHNLDIASMAAAQGVLNEEVNSRGIHFTGTTRVIFDNAGSSSITGGFGVTPFNRAVAKIDHLLVGGGNLAGIYVFVAPTNLDVTDLELLDTDHTTATFPIYIDLSSVSGNVKAYGKRWTSGPVVDVLCANIPPSGTKDFSIPVQGLIKDFRVYTPNAATLSGLTAVQLLNSTMNMVTGNTLVAGGWGKDNVASIMSWQGDNYNSFAHTIRISTNSSFPVGGFLIARIQMMVSQPGGDTGSYGDASLPSFLAGSGAPTANASFLGQRYLDVTNHQMWQAVQIGTGATDWDR